MPTRAVVRYLACLIEYEGYIGIEKRKPHGPNKSSTYTAKVTVEMGDREPVDLLRATFGGSSHYRRRPGWKPMHACHVTSRMAERLLTAIRPYLIIPRKRRAADACLNFLKQDFAHKGQGVRLTPKVLAAREAFYQVCKKANKRGGAS
jgi:hypothetical protein